MYLLLVKKCTVYQPCIQCKGFGTTFRSSRIDYAYWVEILSLNFTAFLQQNCLNDSWFSLIFSSGYFLFLIYIDYRASLES